MPDAPNVYLTPNRPPPRGVGRRKNIRDGGPRALSHDPGRYDADELELLKAVEAWKKANKVRFPSVTDVLRVAKGLGWRKAGGPQPEGEGP